MMSRYLVMESESRDELAEMIDVHTSHGWKLQGGISVTSYVSESDRDGSSNTIVTYYQAITYEG